MILQEMRKKQINLMLNCWRLQNTESEIGTSLLGRTIRWFPNIDFPSPPITLKTLLPKAKTRAIFIPVGWGKIMLGSRLTSWTCDMGEAIKIIEAPDGIQWVALLLSNHFLWISRVIQNFDGHLRGPGNLSTRLFVYLVGVVVNPGT